MVDKEQVELLKSDVGAWNIWRKANPGIWPDLREAILSRANLRKANLSKANLSGASLFAAKLIEADLSEADLSGANIRKANLSKGNLRGVDLTDAELDKADLSKTDLSQAHLSRGSLYRADLIGATLSGADLSEANLSGADLSGADLSKATLLMADLSAATLSGADLSKATLEFANLSEANLRKANLTMADLIGATLSGADLTKATLEFADLSGANLRGATFRGATLSKADLSQSIMLNTDYSGATLTGCKVYGLSAWDVNLTDSTQLDLIITPPNTPTVVVDNIEVAQFVYLLLNNEKIRGIIDTIGAKGVLILGRFTEERKAVLDAIRKKLRELGFVPMMFDFDKPTQRDFTETIMTLAGMCRFIIADITNPKSSPLELAYLMPNYMIPFVPIIQEDEEPFSMFRDLKQKYGEWVLDVLEYDTATNMVSVLEEAVVMPALEMSEQLRLKKAEDTVTRHVDDFRKIT